MAESNSHAEFVERIGLTQSLELYFGIFYCDKCKRTEKRVPLTHAENTRLRWLVAQGDSYGAAELDARAHPHDGQKKCECGASMIAEHEPAAGLDGLKK